jgi:anti-sigma factor RsiW
MAQENFLNDDLLWDYADGLLSEEQRMQVDALLRLQPEAQLRLDAILAEMRALKALPLGKPDAGFADRVMVAWVGEQALGRAQKRGNDWIIWAVSLVFSLVVLFTIISMLYSLIAYGSPELPETVSVPELPQYDLTGVLTHPLFRYGSLLLMSVLFLRLLDKFLYRKMKPGSLRA